VAEKKSNDSIGKTLLVVLVLCLVCSIVVAGSAVGLKSRQQAQRALDPAIVSYQPDSARHALYQEKYHRYQKLITALIAANQE